MKPQLRAILLCLAALLITALCLETQGRSVFRLHVIANSDSEEDQSAKLAVRDALLLREKEVLSGAKNRNEAQKLLMQEGSTLLETAETTLKQQNMDYGAQLEIGEFTFPERQYGDEIYPAGDYPALRVVLGDGEGQNWWCVMFPPLCLADLDGMTRDEAEETLGELRFKSFLWEWLCELFGWEEGK